MPETDESPRPFLWRKVPRIISRFVFFAVPFVAAGNIRWIRGWIWIGLAAVSAAILIPIAAKRNPEVAKARSGTRPPSRRFDKVFVAFYALAALSEFVVAGLDARWGWSQLSVGWLYMGLAVHAAALVLLIAVAVTNPFLEGTVRIQSDRGHTVVASGPYALVRHPMYAALIVMYPAWALVLGSAWACLPAGAVIALFFFRAANEDRTLMAELPGYGEYAGRTRYRLVPGVW